MDPHDDNENDHGTVFQPDTAVNDGSDEYTFVEFPCELSPQSVFSWNDDDDASPVVSDNDNAVEPSNTGTDLLSIENALKSWLLFGNVRDKGGSSDGVGVVKDLEADDDKRSDRVSRGDLVAAHACRYCGLQDLDYLARCNEQTCRKWFCNAEVNNLGSHITHHVIRAKHREVCVHNDTVIEETILECYICGFRDVHLLGFIIDTAESKAIILCREPHPCIKALNDLNWDPNRWCSLMSDKGFPGWLVKIPSEQEQLGASKIGAQQIYKLEELWKKNPDATLEDLEKPDVDEEPQFQALTYHMPITSKQDHGCSPERPLNELKQRIVLIQNSQKVYMDRNVCFDGGLGIVPSDNLATVATSNQNTYRRGNRTRGSNTPPVPPNYVSRPSVPSHNGIASLQPYTIQRRSDARGLLGATPQVPLRSRGSSGALGTTRARQRQGSKQTKEGTGSTLSSSVLERPSSRPSINSHLSQPGFTTNIPYQGLNSTFPVRPRRERLSQDYLVPGSSQGLAMQARFRNPPRNDSHYGFPNANLRRPQGSMNYRCMQPKKERQKPKSKPSDRG